MAVLRLTIAAVLLSLATAAQTPTPRNEEFDLDIKEERIVETDFFRAKSLAKQNEKVSLEAGAAVSASRIEMTIRGVTGHVRFRAKLDALERLFRGQ